MGETYELWIQGDVSPELTASFHPSRVEHAVGHTALTVPIRDDPELFGILARCEMLGLKILRMEKRA